MMNRLLHCGAPYRSLARSIVVVLAILMFEGGSAVPIHRNMDSLLHVLDAVVDSSAIYNTQLQRELVRYRSHYENASDDISRFNSAHTLFKAYRKYRLDSALYFARRRVVLAQHINNRDSLLAARLNEADALKCLGRLHDALKVLDALPHTPYIVNNGKYYSLYHSILLSLSQMTTDEQEIANYHATMQLYRDSVNRVNRHDSLTTCVNRSEMTRALGQYNEALQTLLRYGEGHNDEVAASAVYWFVLGETYLDLDDRESAKYCYTMASIIDKRNCNKTYTSLQSLAWLLHQEGDTERAYRYITCSMQDVISSKAYNRLSLAGKYLPIITTAYSEKQHTSAMRRNILLLLGILSSVILCSLLRIIYKRNQRLTQMHNELEQNNGTLHRLNSQLEELNTALIESNKIKEEYIGQLFNLCSNYINEAEKSRVKLLRELKLGKTSQLKDQLSQSTMNEDLNQLFRNFDIFFLELFPDFIERFNSLLRPGEQIEVKGDNLLSPELRIYALVRLGINDSTKIASFLHYSTQTVYNYRLKTRNRSDLPKNEFVQRVQHL